MHKRAFEEAGLADIAEKVLAGERLNPEDGLRLYQAPNLNVVGWLANVVRERLHGSRAYYVRNQHINYTNVCDKFCRFCSFYARKDGPKAYVLSTDQVRERVRQCLQHPLTEIHVVGGIHPRLPYTYYLDLLRAIGEERPGVHIKAFTMIEIQQIQKVAEKPLPEVLADLKAAGLASCPGGGVEVLSDRLHEELFGRKLDGEEWLDTAREVHRAGLRSNATMLYGHLERPEERIEHMVRLRALQEETGGFRTFIPLSFHPEQTQLSDIPRPTGCDDLRTIAVSRLMLDNFPHVKAFWVMSSAPVAQAALWYGADDMDGTVIRYEITRDARTDTHQEMTHEQFLALIREAGREPVERDAVYAPIQGDGRSAIAECRLPDASTPAESGCSEPADDCSEPSASRPSDRGVSGAKPDLRAGGAPAEGAREFGRIAAMVEDGERLGFADAVALLRHPNLAELGQLASLVRQRKNPERIVTYVVGRNINYTNVCWVRCKFCTFYRRPGDEGGYVLPREELYRKIEELLALGGTEILMQGGLNPSLRIEWFEELFRDIKERYPIHIHGLSPTEILYLAKASHLSVHDTLVRLRAAGLDTVPGGGAELLVESVKERIAPHKHHPDDWLGVMRSAHALGIPTTATMVYGFGESVEERVEHLMKVRDLQDETGGFTAFIAWSFQPEGTELGGQKASGYDYLRTVAAARLVLDNVGHVQASWLTQGPRVGQISLHFGVDDFGSTVLEENVISAPGAAFVIPIEELERMIRTAGYEPRRRNTRYQVAHG